MIKNIITKENLKQMLHPDISAKEAARSVAIGLFVALTPTFGIQLLIVSILWGMFKFSSKLKFNLPVSISLTFVTNYFTVIPYYFLCYYTGKWIFGTIYNLNHIIAYNVFAEQMDKILNADFIQSITMLKEFVFNTGKLLFIGSLPYALTVTVLFYVITFRWVNKVSRKNR